MFLFGEREMKAIAVFVLVLVSVLLVLCLIGLAAKIRQTSEEKPTAAGNQANAPTNGNHSISKNSAGIDSTRSAGSDGGSLEGNSRSAGEAAPDGASVEVQNDQSKGQTSGNEVASVNLPPIDGRVYLGGEEPYAYVPTYSPKAERLPVEPLPGE